MPVITEILKKILTIFNKLSLIHKVIVGSSILIVLVALVLLGNISSTQDRSLLYAKLEPAEFSKITSKLAEAGYEYSTSGGDTIYLDWGEKQEVQMLLAQENLIPKGIPGYELFDMDKWSETQFEKDIKKQRALMGEITRTLETLKPIDRAKVLISIPEETLFEDKVIPVTAAIQLHYAPGYDSIPKNAIKGIENLVSRAVPGLKQENISISGPLGDLINDFDTEADRSKRELKDVNNKLKIQEKERIKVLSDISSSLDEIYGKGLYGSRFDVIRLDVKLRWDREEIERNEVEPVIMTPDNPDTPYSERVVQDSLEVSSKTTTEKFEGNGFTPEGPAGTEPNIPPGYKDRDYQRAKYSKKEDIKNNEFNKTHRKIQKQLWEYESVNLAVVLDGRWNKKGENKLGTGYTREYSPVSDEEIRNMTDLLKKAIGFNAARGDQISIKHLQKERTKQFEDEDAQLRKEKLRKRLLLGTLFGLLLIAILTLIINFVKKELERRRRLREEELAAQQRMMREAALRALEEGHIETEMSLEDKARQEMLQNVISMANDQPDEVAQLLKTWLAEEEEET